MNSFRRLIYFRGAIAGLQFVDGFRRVVFSSVFSVRSNKGAYHQFCACRAGGMLRWR